MFLSELPEHSGLLPNNTLGCNVYPSISDPGNIQMCPPRRTKTPIISRTWGLTLGLNVVHLGLMDPLRDTSTHGGTHTPGRGRRQLGGLHGGSSTEEGKQLWCWYVSVSQLQGLGAVLHLSTAKSPGLPDLITTVGSWGRGRRLLGLGRSQRPVA